MKENREVKSDVFSMLMQDKRYALEVYNALNGSELTDPDLVEMVELDRGISLTVRNDASFIVNMNLSLLEHQSTYNPNMPLRSLIYISDMMKRYVKERDLNLYGSRLLEIPTPRFIVFYNGTEKRPEREVLKLSDSFAHETEEPELELVCQVLNINPGNNTEFMARCNVLEQYTIFIEKIREYQANGADKPIETAINYCVANGILKDFLKEHREEVLKVMTLDMTYEAQLRMERRDVREESLREGIEKGRREGRKEGRKEGHKEGREEGRREGRREGRLEGIKSIILQLLNNKEITPEVACENLGISRDELDRMIKE